MLEAIMIAKNIKSSKFKTIYFSSHLHENEMNIDDARDGT